MDLSTKITLLEFRLHRLKTRERENSGACRRIPRELRALRSSDAAQSDCPPGDTRRKEERR